VTPRMVHAMWASNFRGNRLCARSLASINCVALKFVPLFVALGSHVETTKRLIEAETEAARQRNAMKEATRQWEATLQEQRTQHEQGVARLREELAERQALVDKLHDELAGRESLEEVAELKRQLHSLQALHFNVESDDVSSDGVCGARRACFWACTASQVRFGLSVMFSNSSRCTQKPPKPPPQRCDTFATSKALWLRFGASVMSCKSSNKYACCLTGVCMPGVAYRDAFVWLCTCRSSKVKPLQLQRNSLSVMRSSVAWKLNCYNTPGKPCGNLTMQTPHKRPLRAI